MQNPVFFEIIGEIAEIETIAIGGRILISCGFRNSMVPADGESLKGLPMLSFRAATSVELNCTGTKPTALAEKK